MTDTATDLSEFEALNGLQGGTCRIGLALADLTPADRAKAQAALAAPIRQVQHAAIIKWFAKRGHELRRSSVPEHRNGNCSCKRRGLV